MRRLNALLILPAILSLGLITRDCNNIPNPIETVIYAQSAPVTLHAYWTPSPAPGVVNYVVVLDGNRTTFAVADVCTTNPECVAPVVVPSFGKHSVFVVAQTLLLDTDPNSLTDSPPSNTVNFTLNQPPAAGVTGVQIKK